MTRQYDTPRAFSAAVTNRRSFLQAGGIATLALLGPGALSACTSAVGQQRRAAGAATGPQRGGTLRVGSTADIVPAAFLTNTAANPLVIGLAYESLVRYPHDRVEATPWLATAWEFSDDGLSLALDLRDGVTFHSGRPFTSKDAEFSIRTYGSPTWTAQLQSTAAAIESYDTSDPRRLVLHFKHYLGNIFDLLDTVPILDSESIDALASGESFIGTGPFSLTNWTPKTSIEFERYDGYWVADRPYLDKVAVQIVPDPQSLVNHLRSGSIDVASGLTYRDSETFSTSAGYSVTDLEGAEVQTYVGANVQHPGLSDVSVRRAIAYALDRERIISEVFRGVGYPINLPWPKSSPAFDETRNATYTRDVARARQELGSRRVATVPLTYPANSPVHKLTSEIVQANLAEIGIPVTLDPVEGTLFTQQLIGQQFKGLWVTFHSWAQYIPSTLTVSAYPFNARKNSSHFASESYTRAAEEAWKVKEGTSAEAIERYRAVSDELLDALFLIEIGVVFNRLTSSAAVQDLAWTKRSELLLTDAYLTGQEG